MIHIIGCKDGLESTKSFENLCRCAVTVLGISGNTFVECQLVSQPKIAEINCKFRGVDKPTDVLSFPLLDLQPVTQKNPTFPVFDKQNFPLEAGENGEILLGSILICSRVARSNAKKYGHSFDRELGFLFVHGLLHLLGFDHDLADKERLMIDTQQQILCAAGLNR